MYRHLHPALFWGYQEVDLGPGRLAYVAFPEKALLDLFHLTSGPIRHRFLEELRFASGQLDPERLEQFAKRTEQPKLVRAAALTARLLGSVTGEQGAP